MLRSTRSGYANALRDSLPDAVQVLDAFHVVKLGTQVLDEVRRRVQQEQLGRRGHKSDPLLRGRTGPSGSIVALTRPATRLVNLPIHTDEGRR